MQQHDASHTQSFKQKKPDIKDYTLLGFHWNNTQKSAKLIYDVRCGGNAYVCQGKMGAVNGRGAKLGL